MTPEKQEDLRNELTRLRKKRDNLISELGEYAGEHNDLRENSAYIHTEQKIHIVDAQIANILLEFGQAELAKRKAAHLKKIKRIEITVKS